MENPRFSEGKVGLVLSGGGAKGAYQVGIVKALAELGVQVEGISGASIGAMNGAVVASSASMEDAAIRLEKLWETLAENPPVEDHQPTLLKAMNALGLEVKPGLRTAALFAKEMKRNLISTLSSPETGALVDNSRIQALMDDYITPEQLARGLPLYVSVFPNRNYVESLIGSSLAVLGIKDNPKSEFLHVQSLEPEEQRKALLASAAIPFIFQEQEIGGELYVDGGLGGLFTSQGNTPIEPLVENGYDTIIVTSLSERSRWSRGEYPDVRLLEIDREEPIDRAPVLPMVFDILSFHPDMIRSWIEQGYGDALRCFSRMA